MIIYGIILSLIGATISSLGNVMVRWYHVNNRRQIVWYLGIISISLLAPAVSVAAYIFTTPTILAPFAVVGVMLNSLFSRVILKELLSRYDVAGNLFICAAIALASVASTKAESLSSMETIQNRFASVEFNMMHAGIIAMMVHLFTKRRRYYAIVILSSVFGAYTNLLAKCFVEYIANSQTSNFRMYVIGIVLLACALIQIFLLNKGLVMEKAIYTIPVYQCSLMISQCVTGNIFFQEYVSLLRQPLFGAMFFAGIVLAMGGIVFLERMSHGRID